MLTFPKINPSIIEIGPFKLRWYGLMYVLGFVSCYFLIGRQRRARRLGLVGPKLQDLLFSLAIGLIIGARLGYILFYQYSNYLDYLQHPLEIIAIWHGGMSFHGGLIGALLAGIIFSRRRNVPFWQGADVVAVTVPIALGLGRLGNFINGELFGRPSTLPWAMVFPMAGPEPRHPSQLYEATLEGVLLFLVLWLLKDRPSRPGTMVCLFLGGYGVLRFLVEFCRQPDPQIGLLWGLLSMGQILCLTMIIAAAVIWKFLPQEPTAT
jgi:phosphatidylglycerol:prolipoprotein diacylglycerol transferase